MEIYPRVPRPIAVLWMGTVASCAKVCPLILDTTICGVQTVPEAVKMPVLIWRVEWEVVIMSPMLMKPLLEPMASESTTRELIYPWVPVTKAVVRDDVKMRPADRVFVEPLKMTPVTVE
jgi:hypothetical protein